MTIDIYIILYTVIMMFVDNYQWLIQDFPDGEGAGTNFKQECQPIIWPNFPENCMKIKKFWWRVATRITAPLWILQLHPFGSFNCQLKDAKGCSDVKSQECASAQNCGSVHLWQTTDKTLVVNPQKGHWLTSAKISLDSQ